MFLRRIVQHLKEQNWTAVGIDFLIVVAGVWLGAEAANWNEARRVREGERDFLERLHADMSADIVVLESRAAYLEAGAAATHRTERFIAAGRPCSGDCWTVLVDFFAASQWTDLTPTGGVMQSLPASPYPYDRALRREVVDFYERIHAWAVTNPPPAYRTSVRRLIPIDAQLPLWDCNVITGVRSTQALKLDCPAGVSDARAREIVEVLRRDEALRLDLAAAAGTRKALVVATRGIADRAKATVKRLEAKIDKR